MAKVKKEVPEGTFITIHWWMINKMDMTPNECSVYACIYGFSQGKGSDDHYFTGTAQYLATWARVSTRTVMTCLKSLLAKGYIIKRERYENNEKRCDYKALYYTQIIDVNKANESYEKISEGGVKNFHRGCEEISHNKDNYKDNYKDSYRGDANKQNNDYNEVAKLYKNICISLPPLQRLTQKRKDAISRLLSVYSLNLVAQAFEKANNSDLLNGKKDGRKVGFDWLMDEDNITKLLEGNYDNTSKPKGRKEQVPSWMNKERQQYDYDELEKSLLSNGSSTIANNPELQARAENLKKSLVGG